MRSVVILLAGLGGVAQTPDPANNQGVPTPLELCKGPTDKSYLLETRASYVNVHGNSFNITCTFRRDHAVPLPLNKGQGFAVACPKDYAAAGTLYHLDPSFNSGVRLSGLHLRILSDGTWLVHYLVRPKIGSTLSSDLPNLLVGATCSK